MWRVLIKSFWSGLDFYLFFVCFGLLFFRFFLISRSVLTLENLLNPFPFHPFCLPACCVLWKSLQVHLQLKIASLWYYRLCNHSGKQINIQQLLYPKIFRWMAPKLLEIVHVPRLIVCDIEQLTETNHLHFNNMVTTW